MASKGYSGLKPYSIEINSVVQRLQRWASTNRLKRVALSRIMSHLQDRKPLLSPLLSFPPMSVLDDDCFDLSRSEKDRLLSPFFSAEERAKVNQWNSALADWGSIKDKLGPEEWSSLVDDIFSSFYSLDHSAIEMELSFDELEGAICGSSEDECAVPNILSQSLRGLGHNEKPNNVRYSSAEFHSLLSSEEDLSIFEDRVTLDTSLLTS